MLRSYLPAIVFLVLGGAVGGVFVVLNSFVGPRQQIKHKQDPYECGLPSEIKRGLRFGISFYLIAMLFLLFDVEVIFLYPIAVELRAYGSYRADRDRRLHRAPVRRLRLRLAPGSAAMEVTRRSARQMLRGGSVGGPTPGAHPDLEREELERHVEERVLTTTLDRAVAWARSNSFFPLGFGLACCAMEFFHTARLAHGFRALRLRGGARVSRARPT